MVMIYIPQKHAASSPPSSDKDNLIGCGFFLGIALITFGGLKVGAKVADHFYFPKHKMDTVSLRPTCPVTSRRNTGGRVVGYLDNEDYIKGVNEQYRLKDERHMPTKYRHIAFAETRADTLKVIRAKGGILSDRPLFGETNENGLVLTKFTGNIKDTTIVFSASDFKEVDVIRNYRIDN